MQHVAGPIGDPSASGEQLAGGRAMVPAVVFGVSACNSTPAPPPQPQTIDDKGTPFGDLLVPKLTASVTDGAVGVTVDAPVTVSAEDGVLGAVTMTNDDGATVAGQLSPDGLRWITTEPLGYNEKYTLSAQSLGLGGVTSRSMTFQTHSPENLTMPYLLPNDGEVVGVGQPVAVRFDENIPNRLAAEKAITVTTNPPVEGAFYWLSNREVRWRPEDYWKPGTTVDVAVNTYGVDLGDGLFGQENVTTALHHRRRGHRHRRRRHQDADRPSQRRGRQDHADLDGQEQHADQQRHLHHRRPALAHGDGFLDLRRAVELAERLPHRGGLRHADVLQRHLRARGAVVGGQPGLQQRQPRLPQRQHQQRAVVLREHQAR